MMMMMIGIWNQMNLSQLYIRRQGNWCASKRRASAFRSRRYVFVLTVLFVCLAVSIGRSPSCWVEMCMACVCVCARTLTRAVVRKMFNGFLNDRFNIQVHAGKISLSCSPWLFVDAKNANGQCKCWCWWYYDRRIMQKREMRPVEWQRKKWREYCVPFH